MVFTESIINYRSPSSSLICSDELLLKTGIRMYSEIPRIMNRLIHGTSVSHRVPFSFYDTTANLTRRQRNVQKAFRVLQALILLRAIFKERRGFPPRKECSIGFFLMLSFVCSRINIMICFLQGSILALLGNCKRPREQSS